MINIHDLRRALDAGDRRGVFAEGSPEAWRSIRESAFHRPMLAEVREEAEKLLMEPIAPLTFSLYKLFDETGSRKEYEPAYFHHRLRLNAFAIMTLIDDKPAYVHALEDAIWAICDEFSWCLPASMGGKSLKPPEPAGGDPFSVGEREHRRIVDLFAAETAFALAEVLHLTGGRLSAMVVYRARKEIRERVIEPFMAWNDMFFWEAVSNNWAAVCGGSVGAAAIYLMEDNASLAPVLDRALGAMEAFLGGYGDDGACTEGIGYWTYGFGFFTYFAALLEQRTGGAIDLLSGKKVEQIALFQQRCLLSENKTVSFSDAPTSALFHAGLTHFLKTKFPAVEAPDFRYRATFTSDHCYRWAPSVRNIVWVRPEAVGASAAGAGASSSAGAGASSSAGAGAASSAGAGASSRDAVSRLSDSSGRLPDSASRLPDSSGRLPDSASRLPDSSCYLPDAQWLVSRRQSPLGAVCFAAKGGRNDEPHNHNDIGSFLFHVGGETLLVDAGMGEYTKQYFGPERYTYLVARSAGHSVPIVEDSEQRAGAAHRATVLSHSVSEEEDAFAIDMAAAYGNDNLLSLIRRFRFLKAEAPPVLSLRDEFRFARAPASVVERFVSFAAPDAVSPGRVRIAGEKFAVDLLYDADRFEFRPGIGEYMSHRGNPQRRVMKMELHLLDFVAKHPDAELSAEFRFVPAAL